MNKTSIIHYSSILYHRCHHSGERVVFFNPGNRRFVADTLFVSHFKLLSLTIIQAPVLSVLILQPNCLVLFMNAEYKSVLRKNLTGKPDRNGVNTVYES